MLLLLLLSGRGGPPALSLAPGPRSAPAAAGCGPCVCSPGARPPARSGRRRAGPELPVARGQGPAASSGGRGSVRVALGGRTLLLAEGRLGAEVRRRIERGARPGVQSDRTRRRLLVLDQGFAVIVNGPISAAASCRRVRLVQRRRLARDGGLDRAGVHPRLPLRATLPPRRAAAPARSDRGQGGAGAGRPCHQVDVEPLVHGQLRRA